MSRAFAFSLFSLLFLAAAGCSSSKGAPDTPPKAPPGTKDGDREKTVSARVQKPVMADVQEFAEFTGRTAAMETIELRARVSGYLDKVTFQEGEKVAAGTPLFLIDPRPFVAEKARTSAALSQIEKRRERVVNQERRARELFEKKAISQDEYDTAKYDLDEVTAALEEVRAADEIANLDVAYTTVSAPISGRIGRRMVDVGNLVTADQTILATLVSDEQLYVYFDMDERTFLRLRRMEKKGDGDRLSENQDSSVDIQIALADSENFDLTGKVDFFDNQLDSATGTLRVRATVTNTDGFLSPGLFVRVRYPIGEKKKWLTIPEKSIAFEQGEPYVFVVGKNQEGQMAAMKRNVELGPPHGDYRALVIDSENGQRVESEDQPITAEDQIIDEGLHRFRNGTAISLPDSEVINTANEGSSQPAER